MVCRCCQLSFTGVASLLSMELWLWIMDQSWWSTPDGWQSKRQPTTHHVLPWLIASHTHDSCILQTLEVWANSHQKTAWDFRDFRSVSFWVDGNSRFSLTREAVKIVCRRVRPLRSSPGHTFHGRQDDHHFYGNAAHQHQDLGASWSWDRGSGVLVGPWGTELIAGWPLGAARSHDSSPPLEAPGSVPLGCPKMMVYMFSEGG